MFDHRTKLAFVLVCLLLAGSRGVFSGVQRLLGAVLHKEPVPLRLELPRIPERIGDWAAVGEDQLMDEAKVETLGTRMYLSRNYRRDGGPIELISVHVAYYTGMIDPVPHVPDRCFLASGLKTKTLPKNLDLGLGERRWQVHPDRLNRATGEPYRTAGIRHPFTDEPIEVTMPVGEFQMRTTEFEDPTNPSIRIYAGYFFIANGRTTPTPDRVRLLAFDLSERHAYYCKVQLSVVAPGTVDRAEFTELAREFLDDFLPQVMRCLPDWWEFDSMAAADRAGAQNP